MVQREQSASKKVLAKKFPHFCARSGAKYIGTVFSGRATHWPGGWRLAFSVRDEQPRTRPVRKGNTGRTTRDWTGVGRRLCARICAPGSAAGAGTASHTYILYRGNQRGEHLGRGLRERSAAGAHHR